jgi:hypothetical protein
LSVGKINKEEAAGENDDPGAKAGTGNAENNGGRKQKEKVVVPSIENDGTESAAFSALY